MSNWKQVLKKGYTFDDVLLIQQNHMYYQMRWTPGTKLAKNLT